MLATSADARTRWSAHSVRVLGSMAFAMAVMTMIQTASIPLLPALPEAFDASIASVSWVATSTLVIGAAFNPIVGRMGDLYGKRPLVLGCLGAALVGTVVAASAGSLVVVVLGRAIQGLGSAVIPLAYGVVRDELPPAHLSRAVSVLTAAGAGLGAGVGPVAVGAVLTAHGWRALFWVSAALVVLALLLVGSGTRGAGARFPARFDLPGAVVLAVALLTLLVGVTNGSRWGWSSPAVVGLVVAAVVMALWWVRWERSRTDPLVDLALSSRGPVLLAHLGGVMVGFATFAQFIASYTLVAMPAATGHGLGRTVAVAGLVQLPGAALLGLSIMVATRISAARGSFALLRGGALVVVAGFALSAVRHGSVWDVVLSVAVVNVGLGASFCSLPIMIMEHVSHAQTAAVNAVNALARVVGSVLSSAIVTALMATGAVVVAGAERPGEWTFVATYGLSGAVAATVAGLAWRAERGNRHATLARNSS